MATVGTVRSWNIEDGWGVVDAAETPGGCWVHFRSVAVDGPRELVPGQSVEFDWEKGDQDGYGYRAGRAWPVGREPHEPIDMSRDSSAYVSEISFEKNPGLHDQPTERLPAGVSDAVPPPSTSCRHVK